MAAVWLWLTFLLAQTSSREPVKATLCEIAAHPDTFEGKLVQLHALVESGVDDIPAGVADDSCGAELKFLTPDDQHLVRLLNSKLFRKMVKDVKKNPVVVVTISGWFRRGVPDKKTESGVALESVEDVVVKRLPKVPRQR
ncbi:MAG: hypothetical protein ABSH50_04650 [Bryobacteraceae bacterium]|jgi:hypothetical protein